MHDSSPLRDDATGRHRRYSMGNTGTACSFPTPGGAPHTAHQHVDCALCWVGVRYSVVVVNAVDLYGQQLFLLCLMADGNFEARYIWDTYGDTISKNYLHQLLAERPDSDGLRREARNMALAQLEDHLNALGKSLTTAAAKRACESGCVPENSALVGASRASDRSSSCTKHAERTAVRTALRVAGCSRNF